MAAQQPHKLADWSELASHGEQRSYARHSRIFAADQPADTLFLLHKGEVRLPLRAADGRALTMEVAAPGQLFGHMALVRQAHYDTDADAIRPVEAVAIAAEPLRRLLAGRPELSLALLRELARYRAVVSRRLDEVAFKSVPARLASLLLHMGDASSSSERLPRRTHQQLAEMINAYRETVTKVINQFRDARLLDVDSSGIRLLNVSQLRKLAQE
jgi:CRP-like cAMP-binding protein